jgi:hypothetical protein
MIKFFSGFFLGYMVAKRPPTQEDINMLTTDIQNFVKRILV